MKTLRYYIAGLGILLSSAAMAQQPNPDQNPNFEVSRAYYMEHENELTANQGQTVQQTYEAFDWTTYKTGLKQDRKDRRYELQKMRYQTRYRCNYGSPYYGNGYNGYNNYYSPYNNNYNPYYSPYWFIF